MKERSLKGKILYCFCYSPRIILICWPWAYLEIHVRIDGTKWISAWNFSNLWESNMDAQKMKIQNFLLGFCIDQLEQMVNGFVKQESIKEVTIGM